jgi:hypothetical protein
MFASSMILLAEKLFLHFVAINFHERALADRLAENRLALKALDRLSNVSAIPPRRPPMTRRGHKSPSSSASLDALTIALDHTHSHYGSQESSPTEKRSSPSNTRIRARVQQQKKRKAIASVIVDQVGGVIGQVALKNADREGISGLYSAKKLARKLFSTLKYSYPPRSHLVVEGMPTLSVFRSLFNSWSRF